MKGFPNAGAFLRTIYAYNYSFRDLLPLMEFQTIAEQESAMGIFVSQPLLAESLQEEEKEEEVVLAEAAGKISDKSTVSQTRGAGETTTKKTYVLTYYDPETHKAEILEASTDIRIKDYVSRMIEESVGMRSAYPLYTFIGSPIMKREIIPWKLEKILSEREYGTPPPSGSGATVIPVRVIEQKKSEIIAIKKNEEVIRSAIAEAIIRKEKSELRIDDEIMLIEEAVEALRSGESIESVLERLPPLSRARYIIAMRKKMLGRRIIINLLLHDASFLKRVKKRLEMFTIDDLLNMVKILRGFKKKPTS